MIIYVRSKYKLDDYETYIHLESFYKKLRNNKKVLKNTDCKYMRIIYKHFIDNYNEGEIHTLPKNITKETIKKFLIEKGWKIL